MDIKEKLVQEMETTLQDFHHLLDSVPETYYNHPSSNAAWTIGDVLYHITLGPTALRFEIWMIVHTRGIFQLVMNDITSNIFNRINAMFASRPKRITRQGLLKAYESGHAGLISSLKRLDEDDLRKSVIYPKSFVPEIAGEVSAERLFHYITEHFDIHAKQIREALKEEQ